MAEKKSGEAYKNASINLLILDLDETLIHATKEALGRKADFELTPYHVYKRPYLDYFLEEVAKDFLLAIWSSASDDYVEVIVEQIIPKEIKLEFVWGGSRCAYRRNRMLDESRSIYYDYSKHYIYEKPLKKVRRQGYHLDKIIIVDDTREKVQQNYGNAIYPNPFEGDEEDRELYFLAAYLKTLKEEHYIRSIEKRDWREKVR